MMSKYGLYKDPNKTNLAHIYLPEYHKETTRDLCGVLSLQCLQTFDSLYTVRTTSDLCEVCLSVYTMLELAE